jgi:predicted  nucleic acid-binding Zn-ribbon protein
MEELRSLADLLDLQDVDLQIDRLLHQRQSLPELDDYRAAHTRVQAIQGDHDTLAAELRQTTLDVDRTSGELEIAEQRYESEQNRLFAGGMSARDADYLRREVEMLGRKKDSMESEILELMERKDEQEERLNELAEELATASAAKDRLERVIAAAWKEIDAESARKEARKGDIVPLIDPDLLELYEELRPIKDGGVAVARLGEGICGACHLTLTPAEQVEAKRSDPPRCIHCRCILVP